MTTTERQQTKLVLHGAIVLFVGNLCGLILAVVLSGGESPETARSWNVAHGALIAGGVMLIAVSAALRHLALGPRPAAWLVGSMLTLGYGAVVALVLGATAGVRGFVPTGPPLNLLAFAGNMGVTFGSLVGGALLIVGAGRRLRT